MVCALHGRRLSKTSSSAPHQEKCVACRRVKRQDFSPTNYTTRCSTLSTPARRRHYACVSCLVAVAARPSRTAPRRSLPPRRRWCPRARIARFVLFVIKIPNAPEGIRSRQADSGAGGGGHSGTGELGDGRGGCRATQRCGIRRRRRRRVLCTPGVLARLFITAGNTDIFVRDYGESAERSSWCAPVAGDETRR